MADRILLISQVFYPDEVSTANLFTNLCSELVKENVDVDVWCAQPSYTTNKKQSKEGSLNGINIRYLASTNFKKSFLIGRLLNYLSFTISVSLKLFASKDKTTIFTHTTPPSLGIIISFICSLKKRIFVYILLDIFPEGLIRLGKVSGKNPLIKIWHKLFMASLRRSDKIIAIGRDMTAWIQEVCNEVISRTVYIPLWQDDSLINPIEYSSNNFIQEKKLQEKFILQYSGNMGLWNEMDVLRRAVNNSPDDLTFMFVGGGMREKELYYLLPENSQDSVISMPFQPIERFNLILTACHVGLVTLRNGLEGMAVPSKIYGIMAAGIPVIAMVPSNSEIAIIIREENCGLAFDPTDVDGLIEGALKLRSDEYTRIEMGKNGRIAFEKKYTTKIIALRYKTLIQELNLMEK